MTEISVEVDGKTYTGRIKVEQGLVTVHSVHGRKSAPNGGLPAESLAQMLLCEIVKAERARKDSMLDRE